MDKNLRRLIILENYQNPFNKKKAEDSTYIKINTNNESCIDNLDIYFKIENDLIKDISFEGEACVISTSATSIVIKNLIGKSIKEAKELLHNYEKMISEQEYNKEILKELNAFDEIYLQPNRKNCALLPSKAVKKIIKELENEN